MKRRTFIYSLLLSAVISTSVLGAQVNVVVDGITLSSTGTIVDGRTLVPIRDISEALGAAVAWDSVSQKVTLSKPNVTINIDGSVDYGNIDISMVIGQNSILVNGEEFELDVPAQIIGDKTMVPLREVGGWFGGTVTWDDSSKTAYIEKGLNDNLSDAKYQQVQVGLAEREAINRITSTPIQIVEDDWASTSEISNKGIAFRDSSHGNYKAGLYMYGGLTGVVGSLQYDLSGFDRDAKGVQTVNGIKIKVENDTVYFSLSDLREKDLIS